MSNAKNFFWEVKDLTKPTRLDVFCASKNPSLTRSQIKTTLVSVKVNGTEAKLSKKIFNGDMVDLKVKPSVPESIELFPSPLKIVYEDKNIIVVEKPSGMVSHPAAGHYTKTLVNALEFYRRELSDFADEFSKASLEFNDKSLRRGIVHRLDKDTSGLILTARNKKAESFYIESFKKRKIEKYYIAILNKPLQKKSGLLMTSIFRSKHNRQKFLASSDLTKGKLAVTRYKVLKELKNFSLVLFKIYTGRTHQIRVHSKFLNSGIVGDPIYNKDKKHTLMLHAIKLKFKTQEGNILNLKTKVPERFLDFWWGIK
ncbi:MAG: RluA family pseudouridine synthase [Treponemataceae bacterium]